MYLWSREVWRNHWAALACASLFIWAPYHIGSIYLRGSYAELLAMAWWPLILFGIARFVKSYKFSNLLIVIVGSAALFLSHNVLTLIFMPVAVIYLLAVGWKKWRTIIISLFGLAVGAGLSSFFWLPAFIERKHLNLDLLFSGSRNYTENFISLKQLVYSNWDNYLYLVGLTGLVMFVLLLNKLLSKTRVLKEYSVKPYIWLVIIALSIYMSSWPAKYLWDNNQLLQFFQFPWRFLSLVSLAIAIFGGVILMYHKNVHRWSKPFALSLIIIGLTILINYS